MGVSSFEVSICMPAFNASKYIGETLCCISGQTFDSWELIVVDDGSTDETVSIVKQFESHKIRLIKQQNKGAAAARNNAYLNSKGKFIKFMDADDLISKDMLETQWQNIKGSNDKMASCGWGRFYGSDLSTFKLSPETCWDTMDGLSWIKKSWEKGFPMTQPGIFMMPRTLVEQTGLWDVSLSLNDDMEYYTKTILSSSEVVFCKDVYLYYRSGLGNFALSATKSRKGMESDLKSKTKSIEYLLSKENSPITQKLAANILQQFCYECILIDKKLVEGVEMKIQQLGGSDIKIPGGRLLKLLDFCFGWKMARELNSYIRG